MDFEYNRLSTAQNLLKIEDIGNFAIEACTEDGVYFYMVARTSLGTTTIFTWGPVIPDIDHLPNGYTSSLKRMEYKEVKIIKEINTFLNTTFYQRKKLCEAKLIDMMEAAEQHRDLREVMVNYGNGEDY